MIFSKKILIISLIVIVVAVLAFFIFFRGKPDESEEASAEKARKVKETPLPVKVVEVRKGDLIIKLKSPGEAVTNMKINMKAEVAGVIKSLNVEESKHVKKGELLVELDDEKYRLDLPWQMSSEVV